jgi:hypothetical protein
VQYGGRETSSSSYYKRSRPLYNAQEAALDRLIWQRLLAGAKVESYPNNRNCNDERRQNTVGRIITDGAGMLPSRSRAIISAANPAPVMCAGHFAIGDPARSMMPSQARIVGW